jgi:flagellum-specific peptidoglycan hydrolase FlgJ
MKIKIILVIVMVFLSFLKIESQNQISYIDKFNPIAQELMKNHNIPVSVILGISMLESGNGTSKLSQNKHNYFGVKKGKSYRGYESDSASFKDFCKIISRKKYYDVLIKNNIMDYKIWLTKIQGGRYSESKNWKTKVLYYIEKYKLYELDKQTTLD